MQRLYADTFLKPERAQAVAFAGWHRGPIYRADNGGCIQGKLVELHAAYLQPIRNNIKRDSLYLAG